MGMMGGGMMGGSGGGMGMMGGGMMGGSGGGMGMMGGGMMRMMMSHMMGGPGGMGGMMNSGMMARMSAMLGRLNLSPQQWNKVRKLARDRLEKMVDLQARQAKLQIELSSLRWNQKVDPKRVKKLFADRAKLQADMFLAGLDYLRGLKGILTPEQAKMLEGWNLR